MENFLVLLLSGDNVDGVCEGVYASHVLVHVDSHGECLRSARLKHGARSVVPCYSEVLLCNQRDPVTNGERKRSGYGAIVNHTNLSSSTLASR